MMVDCQSSTQEIGEELVNGVVYSISLRKVQVHHGATKGQRWLGCENESALNLYETCKVRTVKAGTLEKLVGHLVPAFQGSDLSYVTVFLCTYRAFTTTQQVLDLLFERYGCILPYAHEDGGPQDQLKNWWPMCSSTCPAPTWSAVPTFSWPSWSTRSSPRQSQRLHCISGSSEGANTSSWTI